MLNYTTLQQTVPAWREGDFWLGWLQALPHLEVLFWLTAATAAGLALYTQGQLAAPVFQGFRRRMLGLLGVVGLAAGTCAMALASAPSPAWRAEHAVLLESLDLAGPSDTLPSRSELLALMGPYELTLAQLKSWETQLVPNGVSPEAFHQFADVFLAQQANPHVP